MAKVYLNRAWMNTATTGTGTITLGTAVTGYLTFAEAGATNGDTLTYVIRDGSDFELGVGTYTSSGTTLSRDTVIVSEIAGVSGTTKLTLSGSADVFAATSVADLVFTDKTNTLTANQIIQVTDNTNAALRVTQLGTGNAIVVEDSTNPDSTPFAVTADGQVLVGHTSALTVAGTSAFGVQVSGAASSQVLSARFSADTLPPRLGFAKSRNATVGSHTIVNSGDVLSEITSTGSDGVNYIPAASIAVGVDGTPGVNDMPGRIVFSTTADGASTVTERMRIDSVGNVGVGKTPTAPLDVSGTVRSSGVTLPSSGAGLEVVYDPAAPMGYLSSYDRTGLAFKPLTVQADTIDFNTNGVNRIDISTAGAFRYFTDAGANPGAVVARHWTHLTADYTLTSTTSEQKAFDNPTDGTLTLPSGVYEFECFLYLTTMSATSGNFAFDPIGAGTAVADRFGFQAVGIDNSNPLNAGTRTGSASVTQQSPASVVTAGTGTGAVAQIRGMFRVSTAGTIIPSVALVTAAAAVVKAGSYFKCAKIGESSESYVGAWT